MPRRVFSFVFYGVFALCFIIMAVIMIIGYKDQKNDEKKETERYEKMINEGSRTVLTDKILEEDHDEFVKDADKSRRTFISLLVCFGAVVLMFCITTIFNIILGRLEGGRREPFFISIVSFVMVMVVMLTCVLIALKVIVPKFASSDQSNDHYSFKELKIKDTERKKEYIETGTGDSRTTETRITYFLIEENGNKIEVNKMFYDRFVGEGIYYAGMTYRGSILSLYPGIYFELEKK